ncbi:MAG TPA: hypothetical protein VFI68_12465 [Anaerolineales bacterium]|nr:hypothetical protein [Anaerolineales bacterium]
MKSNNGLIFISILFLLFAAVASVVIWSDIPSAVRVGLFAFGFGAGVPAGALISRRQRWI